MKITRNELRKLIIEAIEPKKEGGAAGIDLLIKAVKGLETKRKKLPKNLKNKKSIARYILKMNDILKHRNGDIILTIGLPKK